MKSILCFVVLSLVFCVSAIADPAEFSLLGPGQMSQDVDVWPQFEWEASSDTCNFHYELFLSTDPQFGIGNVVVYDSLEVTVYRPAVDLVMGETFYWKVKAVNEWGAETWATTPNSPFGFWILQTIPETERREINGYEPLPFDRTLIIENTPYTLHQGDLQIPQGITLTVREGITFEIEGDRYVYVSGCIIMQGSEAGPIQVTTNDPSPSPGDWQCIQFESCADPALFNEEGEYISGPMFQHVHFTHAGISGKHTIHAIYTPVYIDNCVFEDCSNDGAIRNGSGHLTISNNQILNYTYTPPQDCEEAIYCTGDNCLVSGNTICNSENLQFIHGIRVSGNHCRVTYNSISHTRGAAITFDGSSGLIAYNEISNGQGTPNDGGGIYSNGLGCSILGNEISGGQAIRYGGGLFCYGDSSSILRNVISDCQAGWKGGGTYLEGNDLIVEGNFISNCFCSSFSLSQIFGGGGCYIGGSRLHFSDNLIQECTAEIIDVSPSAGGAFGGGALLWVDDSIIAGNTFTQNICIADNNDYAQGGGISVIGSTNTLSGNAVNGNSLQTTNSSSDFLFGAGIYLVGSSYSLSNCTIIRNVIMGNGNAWEQGGGIHIESANVVIDSCTISGNSAHLGGGIYSSGSNTRINFTTITNNFAQSQGGGILGCRCLLNSIVKYNEIGDSTHAGGIEADADSICFCNISHNQGYQLYQLGTDETIATHNWWFTRSDEVEIENGIYDGHDTGGSLGVCTYNPFLTDGSETAPDRFSEVTAITPMDDATYTTPLSHTVSVGDTLFFQIEGVDSNPYNRDVTVANAFNWGQPGIFVSPFFEETTDTSGTFHCRVILCDQLLLPDMILIANGDSLEVEARADNDYWFGLIVGGPPPATYTIEPDGSGDFPTIQAAIDAAANGEVIELAPGTFTGDGNRDLDFLGKAITLRAQPNALGPSIIDCEGSELDPHRGMIFANGEGPTTIVEGIMITGGWVPADTSGAGILCLGNSAPTIIECTILESEAGDGGAIACYGASPRIENCTIAYVAGSGGVVCAYENSTLDIISTIVAFSDSAQAASCDGTSIVMLECCDIYANGGGDFVGCLEGQGDINGNISWDPLFCAPDSTDFHLDEASPCAPHSPPNPECALIGAWPAECYTPPPPFEIAGITDVPNDQGRQVRLRWNRHEFDQPESGTTITSYSIWRRVDLREREDWEFITLVPAGGQLQYLTIAPTLCDSTSVGICWSTFFVRAHTDEPLVYFDSPEAEGYSIDNLAPSVPENFLFDEGLELLTWDAVPDEDFDYYTIYGSDVETFGPEAVLVGYTIETEMDVSAAQHSFYFVTATDFAGNEGEEASVAGYTSNAAQEPGILPSSYALYGATPNPITNSTMIAFDLPEDSRVQLRIFDPAGRTVAVLADGEYPAGAHRVTWSNREGILSGVYFCKMETAGFVGTRRLLIAK